MPESAGRPGLPLTLKFARTLNVVGDSDRLVYLFEEYRLDVLRFQDQSGNESGVIRWTKSGRGQISDVFTDHIDIRKGNCAAG